MVHRTPVTISLCLIFQNEQSNLEPCLTSARALADELIVVDTGSTDATKDIALRHNARVLDFPWCDDFSAARNASLSHARGDWIFWLDADDRIDEENRAKLRTLFASLRVETDTLDAYVMRCLCHGAGLASHEVDHVRLFRNHPGLRFEYPVHEQIAPSVLRAGGRLIPTDIVIQHVGYADPAVHRAKQERNLRLLEKALLDRPLNPYLLYYRGTALLDVGRSAEAIVPLTLASSLVPRDSAIARLLPVHLAEACEREGMAAAAADVLRVARETYPTSADVAFAEATALYREGKLEQAVCVLRAFFLFASEAPRPGNVSTDTSIATFRARYVLGSVLYLLGHFADAELEARRVVEARPEFGQGWLLLGDALLAQGKRDLLRELLARVETGTGGVTLSALLRASERLHEGDPAGALELVQDGEHEFLGRARDRLLASPSCTHTAAHLLCASVLPPRRASTLGTPLTA